MRTVGTAHTHANVCRISSECESRRTIAFDDHQTIENRCAMAGNFFQIEECVLHLYPHVCVNWPMKNAVRCPNHPTQLNCLWKFADLLPITIDRKTIVMLRHYHGIDSHEHKCMSVVCNVYATSIGWSDRTRTQYVAIEEMKIYSLTLWLDTKFVC